MPNTLQFNSVSPYPVSDNQRLVLIKKELEAMHKREVHRHLMDQSHGFEDLLCNLIDTIDEYLNYEPSDDEICGEPPMSAAEIHHVAWVQHQELHR